MREVCVVGIGQTPIGELWDKGLRQLAFAALQGAINEAGIERPDALYVGNMMAARLSGQAQLGALIADFAGWRGIEAATVEGACGSGGLAFQAGVRAVASGFVDAAAVVGVEKMTDGVGIETITSGLLTAADADYEAVHGATFVALNALLMQRYMYEHALPHEAFAPFSLNAHKNAANNPRAMFPKPISLEQYKCAPAICSPINLYDSSPVCDGAAATIVVPVEMANRLSSSVAPIRVLASATGIDSPDLGSRRNLSDLTAVRVSAVKAYQQAGITPADVDVFEAHDAFSIMAALSLEASGFCQPGEATRFAAEGQIAIDGLVPISTMGGLKARGHPVGATGIYEIVDVITQLRGEAGKNQVKGAEIGMSQNIGGTGSTVVTHLFTNN
jgi:acetyl-CoA C-acetyltransferase